MAEAKKPDQSPKPQNSAPTQRDNRGRQPVLTPVGMATSNPPKQQPAPGKTPWPIILVAGAASLLLVFFLALAGSGGRTSAVARATVSPTPGVKITPPGGATAAPKNSATAAAPQATLAPFSAQATSTLTAKSAPLVSSVVASPLPARATSAPDAMLDAQILGAGYEHWGRPTNQTFCGDFNDKDPVYKFTVPMRVTNYSSQTLSDWYAVFYLLNDKKAFRTCYYGYDGSAPFPSIKPGESVNVTFAAFVELQDRDKIVRVEVGGQGIWAKRCFSGQNVVAC